MVQRWRGAKEGVQSWTFNKNEEPDYVQVSGDSVPQLLLVLSIPAGMLEDPFAAAALNMEEAHACLLHAKLVLESAAVGILTI